MIRRLALGTLILPLIPLAISPLATGRRFPKLLPQNSALNPCPNTPSSLPADRAFLLHKVPEKPAIITLISAAMTGIFTAMARP